MPDVTGEGTFAASCIYINGVTDISQLKYIEFRPCLPSDLVIYRRTRWESGQPEAVEACFQIMRCPLPLPY